ncbi:MAG TPA: hypothetical protein PLD88_12700, partial [Candidatus Berkiella sp.]|nr:hypothetical protein [Candidatus Berkiella sp.]
MLKTQLAIMIAPKTYEVMNATLLTMNKNINVIHYLVDHVIPQHANLDGITLQLHNTLWEDITHSYSSMKTILGSNIAPLGENLVLFELEKQYRQIVIKHSPYYLAFLENILQGKKSILPPELLEGAKLKLWKGFENFINIEFDICFINKLIDEQVISEQACDNAALMMKELAQRLPQMVKVAHYNQASAETVLKEQLQKRLDWLTHYNPVFGEQMLNTMYKIGNISAAQMLEALSRLKATVPSEEHRVNLEQVIQEIGVLTVKVASSNLDDIQTLTEATIHFSLSWAQVLQIEQASLNQALVLLPHIDKLLLTWRNLFFQSTKNVVAAKLLCERLEELVKKSIETQLKLISLQKELSASIQSKQKKVPSIKQSAKSADKKVLPVLDETIENTVKLLEKLVLTAEAVENKPELPIIIPVSNEHDNVIIKPVTTLDVTVAQLETTLELTVDVHQTPVLESIVDDRLVNVHLPTDPTDRVISIGPEVAEILTRLNKAGYWAVTVGGYVRDSLLGIPSNDVDIITNCPKSKLAYILQKPGVENQFIPGLFKIEGMDILCSELSLEAELLRRDLTINTLIADREGKVYDILGCIADLAKPNLVMIGEVGERLA